jgi:hypothetical protein
MSKLSDRDLSILCLGYDINRHTSALPFTLEILTNLSTEMAFAPNIISYGASLLREIITDFVDDKMDKIVLPLSGGYDSRLLLVLLLQLRPPQTINTFTYGTPGSFDYEIGRKVAMMAGTVHQQINLEDFPFTIEYLKYNASQTYNNISPFHLPPLSYLRQYYLDFTFFSGAFGDSVAGSKLMKKPPKDLVRSFFRKNLFINKSTLLYNSEISLQPLFKYLDQNKIANIENLDKYEFLDLYYRQNQYTQSSLNWKDFRVFTPFSHPKWVNFMLALPMVYRYNRSYVKDLFNYLSPPFMKLPFKSDLKKSNKYLYFFKKSEYTSFNYQDFAVIYSIRADFREIEFKMLSDELFIKKYSDIVVLFNKTSDINFKIMVLSLFIFWLNRGLESS